MATAEAGRLLASLASSALGDGATRAALPSSRRADLASEFTIFALYTVLLFAINWSLRFIVFEPIARSVMPQRASKKQRLKFAQAAMEAIFYSGFSLLGLAIVPSQPWVWPSSQWWDGFTAAGDPHGLMRDDLRCYYLLYTARYTQGVVSTLLEARRADFLEMLLHHSVTVVLCAASYAGGYVRVGAVVMFLLDPADIPLHFAKMCKYTGLAFVADRLFELFALMWLVMRLMMYPYVCWSAHVERVRFTDDAPTEMFCCVLLDVLLVLQFYWFSLLVKAAVKKMRTGTLDDVRSDDEDDEAEPEPKKTK